MRFGPKVYLAPSATIGASAYNYSTAFLSKTGWLGAVGALVRVFQDYNGAGDRLVDTILSYPMSADASTYNYQASGMSPSSALSAVTPQKAALVATFTTVLNSTTGSPIITRSSGSFISDGVTEGHILSMASATNIPFGSVIKSVDSATQVTLDRNATQTASNFTGHASKVPQVCVMARMAFSGTTPLPLYWPVDGIQFGLHTTAAGATDLTGIIMEAWPIFDVNVLENTPYRYGLAGPAL